MMTNNSDFSGCVESADGWCVLVEIFLERVYCLYIVGGKLGLDSEYSMMMELMVWILQISDWNRDS